MRLPDCELDCPKSSPYEAPPDWRGRMPGRWSSNSFCSARRHASAGRPDDRRTTLTRQHIENVAAYLESRALSGRGSGPLLIPSAFRSPACMHIAEEFTRLGAATPRRRIQHGDPARPERRL